MNRSIPPAFCAPSFDKDIDPENKKFKEEVLKDFFADTNVS